MPQLTDKDFQVWGNQKASAKLGSSISGPIGGYNPNKKAEPPEKQKSSSSDDCDNAVIVMQPAKDAPLVTLNNPRFIVPSEGVTFNGFCEIAVDVEYLDKTILSRVTFELRAIHNKKDELIDNNLAAEENNGTAQVKARLFYHSENRDDSQTEYYFIARHCKGKKEAKSPLLTVPIAQKIVCDFVEIPDISFNFDGSIPCLDPDCALIASLVAALKYARDNPAKEIVLFGHSDTTGNLAHNFDLSQWRSEAVKALLDNARERWTNFAGASATIEDHQRFLHALTKRYGWQCDPGPIDGKDGPKTKAGRESFQRQYNGRCKGNLKIDSIFGPKSWGAMFDVQRRLLEDAYKEETGSDSLPKLTFGHNGKGVYPCGESFPVDSAEKDNYRSAQNRRVEIVFFEKGKVPKLLEHPDKFRAVTITESPVYDKSRTEKKPVPVVFEPVEVKVDACIAFFFDGTGKNDKIDRANGCDSNVAKLYELYDEEINPESGVYLKRKYYLNGVGTEGRWYSDWLGLFVGGGGQSKVAEAFRTLSDFVRIHRNLEKIHIDIFGYSRGASLARHFVNLIHEHGICDREAKPIGKRTVGYYSDGQYHTQEFDVYPKHNNIEIRFLGLFDTVGSFDIPGDNVNLGYALDVHAARIKRVVHYIAKHEYRRNFDLTSIRKPASDEGRNVPHYMSRFIETKPLPAHMEERFFIGSHGDVGGGTESGHQGKSNELALIPLYAMIHEAKKNGVNLIHPEMRRKTQPMRYEKAFKIPEKLEPLLNVCSSWQGYARLCDENTEYFKEIESLYMHDSRKDGLKGGAMLDDGAANRSVFYRGMY